MFYYNKRHLTPETIKKNTELLNRIRRSIMEETNTEVRTKVAKNLGITSL